MIGQTWALSGTGDVAQLYVSQRLPEKPVPQVHLQVAASKVNPYLQAKGWQDVTAPVVVATVVVVVVVGGTVVVTPAIVVDATVTTVVWPSKHLHDVGVLQAFCM